MNCKPIRHNDQIQCHCGLAWDIGEEKPECPRNRRVGDRHQADVAKQNLEHMRVTNSDCFKSNDGHAFFSNVCVHCNITRPMLLNDNGNRSIFDDVDE